MTPKHYSEADLLETYYLQPGQSMPVMMHLASCEECAARYDRLERKLREAAVCSTEKPESFWTRQRMSIARKVASVRGEPLRSGRSWRVAAAAALAFFLGGAVVYETSMPRRADANPSIAAATSPSTPSKLPAASSTVTPPTTDPTADPWQSDELSDFHAVVQWESWTAETTKPNEASS